VEKIVGSSFYIYGTSSSGTTSGKTGYYYPLFVSELDAQQYDKINDGSGVAHTHTFEGYTKTFYMPNVEMNHAVTSIPNLRPYNDDITGIDKIASIVQNQFPDFYKEDAPTFLAFIQAYYDYLEENGKMSDAIRNLENYKDINSTLDEFLTYFSNDLLPSIPKDVLGDKRIMAKYVKNFNLTRGTLSAFKLLFRALFNEEVELGLPSVSVLKVSDGDWQIERYLVTKYNVEIYKLIGKTIKGVTSKSEALVEDVRSITINGRNVMQILLSNVKGVFFHLERIKAKDYPELSSLIPIVEAGINSVEIITPGGEFRRGDIIKIVSSKVGGFGKVVVTDINNLEGGLVYNIVKGGSGYSTSRRGKGSMVFFTGGDGSEPGSFDVTDGDLSDLFRLTLNINLLGSNTIYGEGAPEITFPATELNINGQQVGTTSTNNIASFSSMPLSTPDYGFQEEGEVVESYKKFRDNINAEISIANTSADPGLSVGDSIWGETSGANGEIVSIRSSYNGSLVDYRIDGYKAFNISEKVRIGDGTTIGTVSDFTSNTVGTHYLSLANVEGTTVAIGDVIFGTTPLVANVADGIARGERMYTSGVIKDIIYIFPNSYIHEPTSNTQLTGTITTVANTVTGVGTSFTTDFVPNDVIKSDNQIGRRVVSIQSDTELTTDPSFVAISTASSYGRGGRYRTEVRCAVSSNTQFSLTNQFDRGPMAPFLEDEGLRKNGSSAVFANAISTTSNTIHENVYTTLRDALLFETSAIGTIADTTNRVAGKGFTLPPKINVIDADVASLGIGEAYITISSDDPYWGTGNSQFTIDTSDKLYQPSTGATGHIKGGRGPFEIPVTVFNSLTQKYEATVRVWQDFLQREPNNINWANNQPVRLQNVDGEYVFDDLDTRVPEQETDPLLADVKIISVDDRGILGKNADIRATVGANGTITALRVLNSGFGYEQNEEVFLEATERPFSSSATVRLGLRGVANAEGFYASSRSHVSTKRGFIQDSDYYQEYSYELQSAVSLNRYRDVVLDVCHPSGQKLFGKFVQYSNVAVDTTTTSQYTKKTKLQGTIGLTQGSFDIDGTSTTFLSDLNSGDELIIKIGAGNLYKVPLNIVSSDTEANMHIAWSNSTSTGVTAYKIGSLT
jgi:hypothetical protein